MLLCTLKRLSGQSRTCTPAGKKVRVLSILLQLRHACRALSTQQSLSVLRHSLADRDVLKAGAFVRDTGKTPPRRWPCGAREEKLLSGQLLILRQSF